MSRTTGLKIFAAVAVAAGALTQVASTSSATSSSEVGVSEFVAASSSRCVAVSSASPGDVAVVNITNTAVDGPGGFGALRSSDTTPVYDRPGSQQYSSVNFAAGTPPNPNLAFTRIGSDNRFCYDGAVTAHDVILDLVAVIPATNVDAVDPTRILDTRTENPPPTTTTTTPTTAPPPGNPGDTKNCTDFATYAEAKEWFDRYFPLYGDVARLDRDNNGSPCETLPGGPG